MKAGEASRAMAAQGYRVAREICGNCLHLSVTRGPDPRAAALWKDDPDRQKTFIRDRSLRCALGGFAVMRTATCNEWAKANDNAAK